MFQCNGRQPYFIKTEKKYLRFKYTQEDLIKAIDEINNGSLSLNKASSKYHIPKSTLHNKMTNKVPFERKMGPSSVLSSAEEDRVESWILAKTKLGFPMHPSVVMDAVQNILKEASRPNKFTDDRPGKKWLKLFLQRHPNIGKNTEIISKSRASVTEEAIREWFAELTEFLKKDNSLDMITDPTRVFNADETGMKTCMKSGLVLGSTRNFRNLYEVASGAEKDSITVLCNYSAAGEVVPPMVVFPYKRIPKELALSVPPEWGIGRSDTGWMTSATFFEYVANVFLPWVVEKDIQFPVILFLDGHRSHYNMELYEFCVEHKIVLYCLYPNATHILQPCDVSIFRPLKVEWKEVSRRHKQRTNTPITRHNSFSTFKEAFYKACKPRTITSGFRACGLYPLNPDAVDYSKCIPARRKEIFGKCEILTHQDYQSALKVVEQFLDQGKITEFNRKFDLQNEDDENDDVMYCFWKSCEIQFAEDVCAKISNPSDVIQQEDTTVMETFTDSNHDSIDVFSESFINSLPLQIDDILYSTDTLAETAPNETEVNSNTNNKVNGHNITLHDPNLHTVNDDNIGRIESKLICEEILEMVIENALVFSKDFDISHTGQASKKENKYDSEEKIKVISNILLRGEKEGNDMNKLCEKHLSWPKPEKQLKKRRTAQATLPFVITSNKWVEYHNEKEKSKMKKEDEIKQKKLKREMKIEEAKVKTDSKKKPNKTAKDNASDIKIKITKPTRKRAGKTDESAVEDIPLKKLKAKVVPIGKGDYVIVTYQTKKYPGLVTDIEKDEYEMSTVEQKQGKNHKWRWPNIPDKIWYKYQNIVKKIPEPSAGTSDGYFYVNIL